MNDQLDKISEFVTNQYLEKRKNEVIKKHDKGLVHEEKPNLQAVVQAPEAHVDQALPVAVQTPANAENVSENPPPSRLTQLSSRSSQLHPTKIQIQPNDYAFLPTAFRKSNKDSKNLTKDIMGWIKADIQNQKQQKSMQRRLMNNGKIDASAKNFNIIQNKQKN